MKNKSRWLRSLLLSAIIPIFFAAKVLAGTPGELTGASTEKDKFILTAKNAKIEIQFLEYGVVKVELLAQGIKSQAETYMTVPGGLRPVPAEQKDQAKEFRGGGVVVRYSPNPLTLTFIDKAGNILLCMDGEGITWKDDGSYQLSFRKEKGDGYYGLGEPFAGQELFYGRGFFTHFTKPVRLNRAGQKVQIWNRHLIPPSRLELPFLMSPSGFGLMVENSYRATFDFSGTDSFSYSADGGPARFYVFSGNMNDIIDAYSRLTGRPPMPPAWVTGYMQSRYGYASEDEFRSLMDNFRTRRIPCDALIFDLDWFAHGSNDIRMGELKWSPVNFPNAVAFQKELQGRGFKSITIIEPQIWKTSSNFQQVFDKGIVAKNAAGEPFVFKHWTSHDSILLDFLNPQAREWFAARVKKIHETGVDGWWTDLNEPEDDRPGMFFSGAPDQAAHNTQALLEHMAMAEMYQNIFPDQRLFIMSRAGFIGDWRYGAGIWSGDVNSSWGHLRNQVPIGISASLSGYGFWNSDTGGFHGTPSAELYTRWMQFSAFCPVFRAHGNHSIREPWAFGEKAEADVKRIMELRYRLSPYNYTTFYEMHQTGKPPMRAMFLEFPADKKTYSLEGQYMFGPWFLVAPVTKQGAGSREVYLPAGKWTNFWTEEIITGPAKVKADAPIDRIPLFVREGAIIPMMPLMQFMGEKPMDPVTLHIYPSAQPSTYAIYNDDGSSNQYRNGESAITPVEVVPGKPVAITVGPRRGGFPGMPAKQSYLIVYHHCGDPAEVRIDRQVAAQVKQDVETVSASRPVWSYDASQKILNILVPSVAGFNAEIAAAPD